jgi:hypothetical protein
MSFALILNGTVVQIAAASFPVHTAMAWADISAVSPAPQTGWTAVATGGVWTFSAPATPSAAVLLAGFIVSAQAALDASDTTMHRIAEGVSLGSTSWTGTDVVAWVTYRRALRALLSSTSAGTLPTKPAYPAGT